jgi:PRTRC genetic system protein E
MLKEIYDLMADGDTITIAMTKKPEGEATVSILPSSKLKGLLPINTTGSVEEIEEKLPEIMNAPMARVKGKLVTNTADFEKSLESAETDQKPENSKPASTSTPGKRGRKPGSTHSEATLHWSTLPSCSARSARSLGSLPQQKHPHVLCRS